MATLLWLTIGVLLALLAWLLPDVAIVLPAIVFALTLVGFLLPREVTSVGARIGIGFGAFWVVIFSPNVIRDPLGATGATYLLFGGGVGLSLLGLAAVIRNRARRKRLARLKAAEAVLT